MGDFQKIIVLKICQRLRIKGSRKCPEKRLDVLEKDAVSEELAENFSRKLSYDVWILRILISVSCSNFLAFAAMFSYNLLYVQINQK